MRRSSHGINHDRRFLSLDILRRLGRRYFLVLAWHRLVKGAVFCVGHAVRAPALPWHRRPGGTNPIRVAARSCSAIGPAQAPVWACASPSPDLGRCHPSIGCDIPPQIPLESRATVVKRSSTSPATSPKRLTRKLSLLRHPLNHGRPALRAHGIGLGDHRNPRVRHRLPIWDLSNQFL